MTTKLSHPYKDHPESWQWPEERKQEIEELYKWLCEEPRFPKMSKNHVHQFYHACLYNIEETKKAFHRYVEVCLCKSVIPRHNKSNSVFNTF